MFIQRVSSREDDTRLFEAVRIQDNLEMTTLIIHRTLRKLGRSDYLLKIRMDSPNFIRAYDIVRNPPPSTHDNCEQMSQADIQLSRNFTGTCTL